jgi:Putative MetA-pathway of phenol degradation
VRSAAGWAASAILLAAAPVFAADLQWSVTTAVFYSVGDYGTDKDTTIVSAPVTLGVTPIERLTLSLTVPYIRQTTQNVVVTGGGVAVRTRGSSTTSSARTEDGVGDVLLKGSVAVLRDEGPIPEVAPYVRIKFPTADEDRGLGTGEFDETIGVELSKRLTDRLTGLLGFSYTFIGSPAGEELRDSIGWSLGGDYAVTPPISLFAFLEFSTAIDQRQPDLELRVGAEFRATKALSLIAAVSRGFTEGSADWGVSASLGVRF